MELPVVLALAAAAALATLLVCDLAGGIARAKGRSYWAFFALGLLLWFPALIAVLLLPARAELPAASAPRRPELAAGLLLSLLALVALVAGVVAALRYAP